ncbi:unnamed protein product [Schistosoma curassoni]|uniref:Flagellar hook capping protein n=1 Tax=Schistosoma curassoni TaxID=6186 RepID=A0A183L3L3_9TREM|nr:unnamed protein product [Schistosoma curassoni]
MPTLTGMDSLDPATAAHITAHAQAQPSGPSEVMSGSLQGKVSHLNDLLNFYE